MPSFSNTRSTTIEAAPGVVHALVADFPAWQRWSPWEGLDPALRRTYEGSGVGARYSWAGNRKAGEGTMAITSLTPERIEIAMEFIKPFAATSQVVFDLRDAGAGRTDVAWTMSGQRNIAFAVLGPLLFDRAIAKDFDRGLAALKRAAETPAV